jgi:hypothetical protein
MPILSQFYLNKYSPADWAVLTRAYRLALHQLPGNPHAEHERLARSIMNFFDGGIFDDGILSTLALNRELSLVVTERKRIQANSAAGPSAATQGVQHLTEATRTCNG